MTDIIQEQEASAGEILARLQEHVLLVALHIGWPKMNSHIADADVVVERDAKAVKVDKKFRSSPQWALIPEEWRLTISRLEGHARRCLSVYSRQFTSKGLCLLPISKADEVFSQLRNLRVEFMHVADRFSRHYADILETVRTDLQSEIGKEACDKAIAALPSTSKVREKFSFTWYTLPLGGGITVAKIQQLRQELLDMQAASETSSAAAGFDRLIGHVDELVECEGVGMTAYSDLINEARQALQHQIAGVVEDLVAEPRQAIASEMQKLIEKLQKGNRIQDDTFNALREAIQHMQGFAFLGTPQLQQALTVVQTKIQENNARKLNQERDLSVQLANALQQQVSAIIDPRDMQRASRGFRRVQVAPPRELSNV